MRLSVVIGSYEMDEVVLDLGSEVNVMTKQTWEIMAKPKLAFSPIQLWLANQQRVIPFGHLSSVPIVCIDSSLFPVRRLRFVSPICAYNTLKMSLVDGDQCCLVAVGCVYLR